MPGNEVVIVIRGRNEMRRTFDDVHTEADRAGDDAGRTFGERIDRRFAEVGTRIRERFSRSGQDSGDSFRTGFSGKLMALTEKIGGALTTGLGKIGTILPGALGDAVGNLPPMGQAIAGVLVAGLAVSLAPMIGAAISGAVMLAVGGGVLAGGIALVAKNAQVKSAFSKLKDSLFDQDTSTIEDKIKKAQERYAKAAALGSASGMKSAKYDIEKAKTELDKALVFNTLNRSLRDLAQPLVAPLVRAAKTFSQVISDLKPDIGQLFKTVAPIIDKLAPALGDFFKSMMPGIMNAVKGSVPIFNTLADKLPLIGSSLSDFFNSISENGDDTKQFWSDLLTAVAGLIISLGKIISFLTRFYSAWRNAMGNAIRFVQSLAMVALEAFGTILHAAAEAWGWIPGLGPKLRAADARFAAFRDGVNRKLAGIHDKTVKIRILQVFTTVGHAVTDAAALIASRMATGGIKGAASGATSSGWTWVGENGPELAKLPPGTAVRSAGDSRRMAGQGGATHAIVHFEGSGDAAMDALLRLLLSKVRIEIRERFGGDAQAALGRA